MKPPLLRHSLRELLAIPKVLAAPLRKPVDLPQVGTGEPILVIPGMMSGDASTAFLQNSLNAAGYDAKGWGIRLNTGIRPEFMEQAEQRLIDMTLHEPASIIGWSLGGIYARVLAQRHPQLVSRVATLGTPFSGDRHANRAWRLYDAINDHTVISPPFDDDPSEKPESYTIAFWSQSDGIIAPPCARGEPWESDLQVEMSATHFEMGTSRAAVHQIISTLSETGTAQRGQTKASST